METEKKCKFCQKDVNQKAKKCPYCQSDLRSGFAKHPIATVFLVLFIIGLIPVLFSSNTTSTQPTQRNVSQGEITALETELKEYQEGRWSDIQIGTSTGSFIIRIYAMPSANQVAINNYCEVINELVKKHIIDYTQYNSDVFIYQNGEVAGVCM